MSEKKLKTYTAEFKESAVKMAVNSDQPVAETVAEIEQLLKHPACIKKKRMTSKITLHNNEFVVKKEKSSL